MAWHINRGPVYYKASSINGMLADVTELENKVRSKAKREILRKLRNYIGERRDMLDYGHALALGCDIGSGPTEAACKTLTLGLKRPGMKWDRDHAVARMNLQAMRDSGHWDDYWDRGTLQAASFRKERPDPITFET